MTNSDASRLPGLSAADTRWVLREAQRVLARLGHRSTVVEAVALRVPDGPVVGLDNLLSPCRCFRAEPGLARSATS